MFLFESNLVPELFGEAFRTLCTGNAFWLYHFNSGWTSFFIFFCMAFKIAISKCKQMFAGKIAYFYSDWICWGDLCWKYVLLISKDTIFSSWVYVAKLQFCSRFSMKLNLERGLLWDNRASLITYTLIAY